MGRDGGSGAGSRGGRGGGGRGIGGAATAARAKSPNRAGGGGRRAMRRPPRGERAAEQHARRRTGAGRTASRRGRTPPLAPEPPAGCGPQAAGRPRRGAAGRARTPTSEAKYRRAAGSRSLPLNRFRKIVRPRPAGRVGRARPATSEVRLPSRPKHPTPTPTTIPAERPHGSGPCRAWAYRGA